MDDPDAYPVFYRLKQLHSKSLPNGNEQREYAGGRGGGCKLFFEVEPRTGRIVAWSYKGTERDCVIPSAGERS